MVDHILCNSSAGLRCRLEMRSIEVGHGSYMFRRTALRHHKVDLGLMLVLGAGRPRRNSITYHPSTASYTAALVARKNLVCISMSLIKDIQS